MITLKPWGQEDLIHQGHGYAVKNILLLEGNRTSLHFHNLKHETIIVFKGELSIFVSDQSGEKTIALTEGQSIAIEPKVIHRMSAVYGDCQYFEAQTDHLNDVIRLQDDHSRSSN